MNANVNAAATTLTDRKKGKLIVDAKKHELAYGAATAKAQAIRQSAEAASPKKRAKLLRSAEKYEIRANAKRVRAKQLLERAEGKINDKEWKRIGKSRVNHWFYDRISSVVTKFRPKNPLREEGMQFTKGDKTFENKGRIFLGGTKAMNKFVDEQGRTWLCKEAVTCLGTAKPMGALVTEAASRLQQIINPETAVESFVYRDGKGNVCGSLQQQLDIPKDAFDLFKWQTDTSAKLPDGMTSQILREHVTDWLLCNFDTKGENFLVDSEGRLRGIDKEQSLSYLDKKETQHMSYTYSPNPNKTLYNTVFEMYANNQIDLDLGSVKQYIDAVMAIPPDQYRAIFADVVAQKSGGDPVTAQKMSDKILARRDGLQAEYERFFGELAKERGEISLIGADGKFKFGGIGERTATEGRQTREKINLAEHGIRIHEKHIDSRGRETSLPQKEKGEVEIE